MAYTIEQCAIGGVKYRTSAWGNSACDPRVNNPYSFGKYRLFNMKGLSF